jgi:hypothetical protein
VSAVAAPPRLPPFGRAIWDLRKRGRVPVGDVLIVAGWNRMKGWPWRVVVPDDVDPAAFDYSFVAGISCRISASSRDRMDLVAAAVKPYRPRRLVGVTLEPPAIHVYVRDRGLR